jgi:mono/diheme cytochrome c family protein
MPDAAPLAPALAISSSAVLTASAPTVDLTNVSFTDNVLPIFQQHCSKCHGEENPEEGLELTSYKGVRAGSLNGSVIKPGDPANSYLVKMVVEGRMPKKDDPLAQSEIDTIIAWITAGALEN